MGTRSRIGVMHGDKVKSIYCHWDGYLEGVGVTLLNHYDSARANNLVALGDLSALAKNLTAPEGAEHSFEDRAEDTCVFYGRDRGEKGVEFKVAQTFDEFMEQCDNSGAEYYYIMRDGVWYCGDTYDSTPLSKKLTVLADALQAQTVDQ